MKFHQRKMHKVVVEVTILTSEEPDDAGFDMLRQSKGEFAWMRVRDRGDMTLDEARRVHPGDGREPGRGDPRTLGPPRLVETIDGRTED